MKERPIILRAHEVRAILAGAKTQTRRPVRFDPATGYIVEPGSKRRWHRDDPSAVLACPYGKVGDRLWVKETWGVGFTYAAEYPCMFYRATEDSMLIDGSGPTNRLVSASECGSPPKDMRWHSAMTMPRWASRLTLEIVGVRVERVQQIESRDIHREGVQLKGSYPECMTEQARALNAAFASAWDSLHAKTPHAWAANPWVWVVEFRSVDGGAKS